MAGKTLSNGTMNLRFMQNAARAKQLATAELEQAKVKDEAEWEVSKDVREAWGLTSETSGLSVTYENSYLPFISTLSSDQDLSNSSSTGWRGRRSFNAKGEEIEKQPVTPGVVETRASDDVDWSKNGMRPATISGSGGTVFRERKEDPKKNQMIAQAYGKSARNVIREITDVGSDLKTTRSNRIPSSSNTSVNVFRKPEGVDDPTLASTTTAASPPIFLKPSNVDDVAEPARKNPKSKRHLDGEADTLPAKKKKKKKSKDKALE